MILSNHYVAFIVYFTIIAIKCLKRIRRKKDTSQVQAKTNTSVIQPGANTTLSRNNSNVEKSYTSKMSMNSKMSRKLSFYPNEETKN